METKKKFKTFQKEDFYSKINLHIHSNFSDGGFEFDELVVQAKKLKMKYISITDHNCVLGYKNSKYKKLPLKKWEFFSALILQGFIAVYNT